VGTLSRLAQALSCTVVLLVHVLDLPVVGASVPGVEDSTRVRYTEGDAPVTVAGSSTVVDISPPLTGVGRG
jgi:hypothetical protein